MENNHGIKLRQQQKPVSIGVAETELLRASAVLDLYGGFECTPDPELQAFADACDGWLLAQVAEVNGEY